MSNEEKAVGIGLLVRDLCLSKGVTRDNAETAALIAQQSAMEMAKWKDNQAAAAYCKCCYTRECEDYESDTCDWLEKFKKILKGGKE